DFQPPRASNLDRHSQVVSIQPQVGARTNAASVRVERHNWKDSGSRSSSSGPRAWSPASLRLHNEVKRPGSTVRLMMRNPDRNASLAPPPSNSPPSESADDPTGG